METMFWVWLAVIAISLVIEIITLDLVSVWFACGAAIPFILSAIGGIGVEWQILVFVIVTALLIIFVRKYAQKLLLKNMNTKTNADSLIGKKYRLLEDTDFEHIGSVKVNDVVWTAVSSDGSLIKAGQLVEVEKIDGNKLIIKAVEEKKSESNDEIPSESTKEATLVDEGNETKSSQKQAGEHSDTVETSSEDKKEE